MLTGPRYPAATNYFNTRISKTTKDGFFDRKYKQDFLLRVDGNLNCRSTSLDKLRSVVAQYFIDLNKSQMVEDAQQDRDLANGRLSFLRYEAAQKRLWDKLHEDLQTAEATQAAVTQQQAAAQAEEDTRQAEADAEEQERMNARTTAMMGAMMGMMNQPTFTPHSRSSAYTSSLVLTPSYTAPSKSSPQPATSRLRYANQCVSFGRRTDGGSGISVTNSCAERITVWIRDSHGLDSRSLSTGLQNWTTAVGPNLDYACFIEAGQRLCER